jgi:Carboxypeptidase regulatory-like domain
MASRTQFSAIALIAMLVFALSLLIALPTPAQAQSGHPLLGGPRGVVKSSRGELLEGMMVQLIAQKSAIRTTVYSNADGAYEFPKLDAGTYTLRIARPLEYHPFVQEGVAIDGANALDDIALTRVSTAELLPPFPQIAAQLTGSEWLLSLSGNGDDKKLLTTYCNWCHSYQQIFRNRYDEHGWTQIVRRMTHGAGSPLINMRDPGRLPAADEARLVKWLATVRGPDSKDPPFVTLPRPQGRQTRVIITEYELPRLELATHDVAGDASGNLWYSPHRSSYIGKLDPKTGGARGGAAGHALDPCRQERFRLGLGELGA